MVEWRFLLTALFHIFSSSSQLCSHIEWKYLPSVLSPTEGMALRFSRPVLPRKVSIRHSNTAPFHSGMPTSSWPCWHLASECVPSNVVCSFSCLIFWVKSVSECQRLTCVGHSNWVWKIAGGWMSTRCAFPYTISNMETLAKTLHTRTQTRLSAPHLSVLWVLI